MMRANRGKAETAFEEARDDDFRRRVEHDRQAALGVERTVCEPEARKRRRVRHVEIQPSRPREIERRQRRRPPSGYENAY